MGNELDQVAMLMIVFLFPLIVGYIFNRLNINSVIVCMITIGFLVLGFFSFINFCIFGLALSLGFFISKLFEEDTNGKDGEQ